MSDRTAQTIRILQHSPNQLFSRIAEVLEEHQARLEAFEAHDAEFKKFIGQAPPPPTVE